MYTDKRHPIGFVVRQTGLTSHVIRVWERRHKAVTPLRTPTNRRLYSDRDIDRLRALQNLTQAGHSIGQIAQLPMDQLQEMIRAHDQRVMTNARQEPVSPSMPSSTPHIEACMAAIQRLDADALERALAQAHVSLGQLATIERIVVPLMQQIGELWHAGVLRMTHEHFASAVVRNFLWNLSGAYVTSPHAPQLIVATPAGQLHDIGALIVAAIAREEGWSVIYLGANLPAEEIAAAVQPQVKAVALSIVYPPDDSNLLVELKKLRRYLPSDAPLLMGGRVTRFYEDTLISIDAIQINSLAELRTQLASLRMIPV